MKITVTILTCQRCGHTWPPRKPDVRICPKCKSARWDQPMFCKTCKEPAPPGSFGYCEAHSRSTAEAKAWAASRR